LKKGEEKKRKGRKKKSLQFNQRIEGRLDAHRNGRRHSPFLKNQDERGLQKDAETCAIVEV